MGDLISTPIPRMPVGTHFRVWWFWLPLILGGSGLLTALVLMPVSKVLAVMLGLSGLGCLGSAMVATVVIARGRRWLECEDHLIRVIDQQGTVEFVVEDVTDLTIFRRLHHAGGRLIAETRELRLRIELSTGPRRLCLINRMPPMSADPLEGLIDNLCESLLRRAVTKLRAGNAVEGDGWRLDQLILHVSSPRRESSLPVAAITAVEIIGQEVRLWIAGDPRAVVKLPLATRNTWMVPRLLASQRSAAQAVAFPESADAADTKLVAPSHLGQSHLGQSQLGQSHLGRILFERTSGPVASLLFATIGLLLAMFSSVTLWVSIRGGEPVGIVLGILLGIVGIACVIGAIRVRRTRFCCYERGLERVTMTSRQELPFASIDVFSFESRRNHSQGRYTGTTYTLVFADRSREQGRGIFFSTTVRNTDDELEVLRERVSEVIARRMARSFAHSRRVQWTPELWFCDEVLEFTRPRRLLAGPKLAVIPYDTITNFEIRDGLFHLWTNYQERAVITVKTASANFYPGMIVLEGLVNAHVRESLAEWTSATSHTS